RLGVPILLLFLALGILGGSEGIGGIYFDDYGLAARVGTIALCLILFEGGLNTSATSIRQVIAPTALLATLGVVLTAGFLTLIAMWLGIPWQVAMLVGAIVSSTDAAAVFSVLRGGSLHLQPRLGRTLEVESCMNDPMALILTTTVMGVVLTGQKPGLETLLQVPLQLIVGCLVGILVGYVGHFLLSRIRVSTVGLVPVLTLSFACVSFGLATVFHGSGFMAVFLTGVVLGSKRLPYRSGLIRIHGALAWLSQVCMFLMLGLLVFPSQVLEIAPVGLALALALALFARPLAVLICLFPFRYRMKEMVYVSWIGLRGAVPIIIGIYPVLGNVDGAEKAFNIVFCIVMFSCIIPGATIRYVTGKLKLLIDVKPAPETGLEINSPALLTSELEAFYVSPEVAVCGAAIKDIEFPQDAAIVIVVRGRDLIAAKGNTVLKDGDHVYLFFRNEDRGFIELLFGGAESTRSPNYVASVIEK
ncbi:MAG: potassium/proton antiporter, partial [Fibrobacteres bacterium]|nr:potassium/proton antiporter [Fibrobacterota bacterium]